MKGSAKMGGSASPLSSRELVKRQMCCDGAGFSSTLFVAAEKGRTSKARSHMSRWSPGIEKAKHRCCGAYGCLKL